MLFPSQDAIVFDRFYSPEGYAHEGVCTELNNQAFLDIISDKGFGNLYGEGRIYRVCGADLVFFGKRRLAPSVHGLKKTVRNGTHYFLAITDKRVVDRGESLSGKAAKDALLKGNAVIFDPSFRTVKPFAGSGYLADDIWADGCKSSTSSMSAVFQTGKNYGQNDVIGLSGNEVFYLQAFFVNKDTPVNYQVNYAFRVQK